MQAPSGNQRIIGSTSSRVRELGLVLPTPPTPLGAYVESSDAGNLLFLSGMLPVANGKLAISGRLGDNLSVEQGREAALMASLNALAVAKEHLGDLDRLKKLLKLTVLMATTEQFAEHALVADGASNLFVQIFGPKASHVRLVYGVQSLPVGAPLIVDTVFEIEPMNAFGQDRVSYNSIQVDNLKIFTERPGLKTAPSSFCSTAFQRLPECISECWNLL